MVTTYYSSGKKKKQPSIISDADEVFSEETLL